MKHVIRLILVFCVMFINASVHGQESIRKTAETIIRAVQEKYCPDASESVFDISCKIRDTSIILTGDVLSREGKNDLLNRFALLEDVTIIDSIQVLPDSVAAKTPYGVIRLSVAQMRGEPGNSAEMVSQAVMGSEVRILRLADSPFYLCQGEDNYLGYIKESAMAMGDEQFITRWRKGQKLYVTALFCQAREKMSDAADPVSDLVIGNKVLLTARHGGWYEISLPDSRTGFVRAGNVLEEEEYRRAFPPEAAALIKTAKMFLGNPYLWGGTSFKGVDCSGFVQTVYKIHGIQLRRDADQQAEQGRAVSMEDNLVYLKPGDLLFFGSNPERISHVGMYIGDSYFIHSSGLVRINSFDPDDARYSEYLRGILRSARRFLEE
ncbi:C40 family peptidase [bacterium]|nr:C40 family peptidase [bacterium]